MRKVKNITTIFLLAVGLFNCAAQAKTASTLLQEGLYAEEVDGNIDAAIKIYQQIIDDRTAQKSHIAQAMYRQGMCYLKNQDEQQARIVFGKLVADFSDQTNVIEKVRPLLEEISNTDPAALMPAGTLVYAELGSPGRQIETIMNMLKGTPLENPLAMIGGNQPGQPSGQMNPAGMLSALMNPSMMTEFKKIRGFGLGISGIPQNNEDPPVIAVLFPGKSDALRGMLHAALGMVGQPTEAIEGMQCLSLPGGAGAAFDDNIVIVASPKANSAGQLAWSVKQYKSIIKEPTLATSNQSFAKVGKRERQENALTVWADVDKTFANLSKLFPPNSLPGEIRLADGFVDFENVDDLITSISIKENGIAVETNLSFKDGHSCLAYDMIRTPNLSKSGFEAIPADAAGIISFALGKSESAQAQAASQQIQNLTGLDIGREIFANIEQVTLFVLPPEAAPSQVNTAVPPIATRIGLAITSHNPQQTNQMLTRFLSVANLISSQASGEQPKEETGKYQIALVNGQKLFCYMNQNSKTTVLSLSPGVVETSVATVNNRRSIMSAGSLRESIEQLSPTTSKLVLINVGGAIRLAAAYLDLGPSDANDSPKQLLAQLAEACDATTINILTDEKLNNLNILTSINNIPEMNEVFVPIMQLAQVFGQLGRQGQSENIDVKTAHVVKTAQAPVIDGQAEDLWSQAQKQMISNSIYSSVSSPQDLSANYRVMWDQENLYLLVDVIDDELKNDSEEFYYDDTIELFIDADNSKDSGYGENDYTFDFCWDRTNPRMEERGQLYQNNDIKYALVTSDNGYRLEIKIPWSKLGTKPSPGVKIGLDVHVNDDDDGGERDTKFTWSDMQDAAWENPKVFGIVELAGLVGWWKFDESGGNTASDSSGNNITGTLMNGPKWQPSGGKIGGALEFDGADDYVNTDNATDMSTWTVAVWAKSPEAPSSEMPSGPVSREKNYQINWNHVTDEFRGAAGICIDGNWYSASFGELKPNTWYHLAATYDGENLKAYKDGMLISNNTEPSGRADSEVETLKFGRHVREENFFGGTIDDVRLYNYALSEDEIKALQNKG